MCDVNSVGLNFTIKYFLASQLTPPELTTFLQHYRFKIVQQANNPYGYKYDLKFELTVFGSFSHSSLYTRVPLCKALSGVGNMISDRGTQ